MIKDKNKDELEIIFKKKGFYAYARFLDECRLCDSSGFLISHDDNNRTIAANCVCHSMRSKLLLFNNAQIPAHYYASDLDGFSYTKLPKMRQALEISRKKLSQLSLKKNESELKKGLLLYGSPGTGKTKLICAILKYLTLELGIKSRFIEFAHLLNQLKHGYNTGAPEAEFLMPLVEIDILVIDELGKGRASAWEDSILDQLVSKRYFAAKTTFFTTNYLIDSGKNSDIARSTESLELEKDTLVEFLNKRVNARIYSRLFEICDFVDMDMSDFRINPSEVLT